MARILVFNSVSLDGYFTDENNDMSWAHKDPDRFAGFWPTPAAMEMMPDVANGMNSMTKIVFSRSLKKAEWSNTTLMKGDLAAEVRKLKQGDQDMVVLGSGTIVSQLTQARLIDEYQLVVNPLVLGKGRTMFEGVEDRLSVKRTNTRSFKNGNVVLTYEPAS